MYAQLTVENKNEIKFVNERTNTFVVAILIAILSHHVRNQTKAIPSNTRLTFKCYVSDHLRVRIHILNKKKIKLDLGSCNTVQ